VFEVATLEMIEGNLPQRAQRLVRDWAEQYKGELNRMWKTQYTPSLRSGSTDGMSNNRLEATQQTALPSRHVSLTHLGRAVGWRIQR
jgi:hypothetical protein